ncbi:auxin response factor 23-like [Bidens hawaiensis]|uniref:auxin response factor 23-like n=1 Tax=Bidens hawaiensis TaxID=980011 RepID=UPI00404B4E3A
MACFIIFLFFSLIINTKINNSFAILILVLGNGDVNVYEQLWHECAGLDVKIPQVGDRVFYFPQGHIEQVNAFVADRDDPTLLTFGLPAKVPFKVVDVTLKANPDTDEVFAQFVLLRISEGEGGSGRARSIPVKNSLNCFRKILAVSDASGLGGCGLPKADVAKALPPLDVSQDQVSQPLAATDIHGARWGFEHVFRGNPKRHSLVTGWKEFVKGKNLKAGDTCIFIRGLHRSEFYIGVKRAVRIHRECIDLSGLSMRLGILSEAFVATTTGCNFTVLYHPRMCTSPYIVPYNVVTEALEINYVPGMRFEMACNGKDPEHIIRFSGTITARGDSDPVRWRNSEWRCLEVKWDASPSSDLLPPRVFSVGDPTSRF